MRNKGNLAIRVIKLLLVCVVVVWLTHNYSISANEMKKVSLREDIEDIMLPYRYLYHVSRYPEKTDIQISAIRQALPGDVAAGFTLWSKDN